MYVSMYGYAFRHARGMELKLGSRAQAHEIWEHIFEATPPKVKVDPEVKLL